MQTNTAIAPVMRATSSIHDLHTTPFNQDDSLVTPIKTTDEIVNAWQKFQDLKLKILNDSDFATVNGQRYAKKSVFRKMALAFGISVEITREERIDLKDSIAYLFTAKAISPNGRFMTAVASCHTDEKRFSKASDARAVGQTRACNRCVADLIGWSAPSAEEMVGNEEVEEPSQVFTPDLPEYDNAMTAKQRALLISLINQRCAESSEREEALAEIECYDKHDASEAIKSYLTPQPA